MNKKDNKEKSNRLFNDQKVSYEYSSEVESSITRVTPGLLTMNDKAWTVFSGSEDNDLHNIRCLTRAFLEIKILKWFTWESFYLCVIRIFAEYDSAL